MVVYGSIMHDIDWWAGMAYGDHMAATKQHQAGQGENTELYPLHGRFLWLVMPA